MANPLMVWRERTSKLPGGNFIFNKIIAMSVPYTGSIKPEVHCLEAGHAIASFKDRRAVRNHLKSVHAIALMNLAEFVTGLAMTARLSPDSRAIITGLSIEFIKKARGRQTAECHCPDIDESQSATHEITSIIRDPEGDIVAKATAHWLVGPKK